MALALALLALGGCFGGGQPLPSARPDAPLAPDARRLADLAEDLAEAETRAERLAVSAAALRAAGVNPIADAAVPGDEGGRFVVGAAGETLAGWIPGRIPLHRDSLVIAVAPRDGTADLALVEAARMVVARGAYTQTPARSVLVVLGEDVEAAARLWRRSAVVRVVALGTREMETGPLARVIARMDRPLMHVVPAEGPAERVAADAFRTLLGAATPPTPYAHPTTEAPASGAARPQAARGTR